MKFIDNPLQVKAETMNEKIQTITDSSRVAMIILAQIPV